MHVPGLFDEPGGMLPGQPNNGPHRALSHLASGIEHVPASAFELAGSRKLGPKD